MKKILTFFVILFTSLTLFSQTFTTQWKVSLGGSDIDNANSILQTTDGGYIAAGFSDSNNGDVSGNHGNPDYWIVKLNNQGVIQWQKSLGGTSVEQAHSIIQTTDGGYVVAGYSYSNNGDVSGNHGGYDSWVVKLNNLGVIQWQKSLGGTGSDLANSIVQTADGGYIVAGFSDSNNGDVSGNHGSSSDCWIVKLNDLGVIQWQKSIGGSNYDDAYSIVQTTDGGYIVAGVSSSNDGDVSGNHGTFDYWVVKLNSLGVIQWQKSLGGSSDDYAYSIVQTTDGGYVLAGVSISNNGDVSGNQGAFDYWVVKLNSFGVIQWQKSLGGTGSDFAYSIIQTTDGGYVVAGYSNSNNGNVSGNNGRNDYWIVKLNNLGVIQWQHCLGGSNDDIASSIIQTSDGSYVVAGMVISNDGDVSGNHGSSDFWITKFSVLNFAVSPNYPCQDKYVHLTSEGCTGTTRWYNYFTIYDTPMLIHSGATYDYLVPNTIPLNTAIFFKCECLYANNAIISMGSPTFVRVLGASSYDFVHPNDDFTITPPYPLNVSNSITATNQISGGNTQVIYQAEKGITLNPGFKVEQGAVFTANIGGCQ